MLLGCIIICPNSWGPILKLAASPWKGPKSVKPIWNLVKRIWLGNNNLLEGGKLAA